MVLLFALCVCFVRPFFSTAFDEEQKCHWYLNQPLGWYYFSSFRSGQGKGLTFTLPPLPFIPNILHWPACLFSWQKAIVLLEQPHLLSLTFFIITNLNIERGNEGVRTKEGIKRKEQQEDPFFWSRARKKTSPPLSSTFSPSPLCHPLVFFTPCSLFSIIFLSLLSFFLSLFLSFYFFCLHRKVVYMCSIRIQDIFRKQDKRHTGYSHTWSNHEPKHPRVCARNPYLWRMKNLGRQAIRTFEWKKSGHLGKLRVSMIFPNCSKIQNKTAVHEWVLAAKCMSFSFGFCVPWSTVMYQWRHTSIFS